MLHHRIPSLLAGLALLISLAVPVAAGSPSTPGAGTPGASSALLDDLGYPEVTVTATDDAIDVSSPVGPGLTLVTFRNTSSSDGDLQIVAVEDQAGYDAFQTTVDQLDPDSSTFPPSFYDLNITGGVTVAAGDSGQVVVDLQPGTNAFGFFADTESDGPPAISMTQVEVTGDAADVSEPDADVTAGMYEMGFDIPDQISSGPMVWDLMNTGDQPHFLLLSRYPEPFTADDVAELLQSLQGMDENGTPVATPVQPRLDFSEFDDAYETPIISSGNQDWYEIDLQPGYYVALCFIPDRDTGTPHAFLGMYKVFQVV